MPSRSTLRIIVAVVLVAAAAWFLLVPSTMLGTPEITIVTEGGLPTNKGVLRMPVERTEDAEHDVRAWVDLNLDGEFGDDELIADDLPFMPKKGDAQSVAFPLPNIAEGSLLDVRIAVFEGDGLESVESFEGMTKVSSYDIGELLDMTTVTNPQSAMKGQTVTRPPKPQAAPKPEGVPTTFGNDTPDLQQRKDECAPTSAANSIIRMAGDNGRIDAIPRDPYALVDMLKKEMGWTFQNGVLIEDFSRGKDFVARQLNLPIRSETYSGDWSSVVDRIEATLEGGGGTEIRMKQVVNGKAIGGHMVTVTRVIRTGQQVSVQVHDPLSPSGTDTYEVDARTGELIGYPYMRGALVITTGFLQTWDDSFGDSILDDLEPTQRATVKAIEHNGKYIPLSELHVAEPDKCDGRHYHANRGAATSLDGGTHPDPQPCGYGKVDEKPVYDCSRDGKDCKPVPAPKKK